MRAVLIVLLAAAIGAAAVFFVFGNGAASDRGPRSVSPDRTGTPAVDASSFERLSRSVEALQAAVERLTRRLDQWPERGDSRPAVAPDRIVADRFEIEAAPGAAAKPPATAMPALLRAPPDPERRKALEEFKDKPFDEVSRAHWFWTYDDVIQHYGPPDEIHPVGEGYTINFTYTLRGDRTAVLSFYGGRLLYVNW